MTDPGVTDAPLLDLLDACSDAVLLVEPDGLRVLRTNAALAQLTGGHHPQDGVVHLPEFMPDFAAGRAFEQFSEVAAGTLVEGRLETTICTQSGEPRPGEAVLRRVHVGDRNVVGVVFRPHVNDHLDPAARDQRRRDPLTGLADRSALLDRLETLLSSERSADQHFALLFVDLNDFKLVNDQWGHLVGDALVAEVARRLARCVRGDDTLVRFGGDEFIALLEGADSRDAYHTVVVRMHEVLAEPFELPDGTATAIAASIGVVDSTSPCQTPLELIDAADRAMYEAKRLQAGAS